LSPVETSASKPKKSVKNKFILVAICVYAFCEAQTLDINALRMAQLKQGSNTLGNSGLSTITQTKAKVIVDQAIEESKYIVGPGDEFNVNIISSEDIFTYTLAVSPSGKILIPSIGIVHLDGLNLVTAKEKIEDSIQQLNPSARIHILLSEIREFKIKVIGHLQQPGLYTVTPVSRVSDLYKEIMSELELDDIEAKETEQDEEKDEDDSEDDINNEELNYPELSRRNLIILRNDDSLKVDLLEFGSTGSDINNPFLHQGDIVLIPLMDHIVGVFGGIKIPGDYEFVRGESLTHIIKLAGGLRPDADPKKIQITRFTSPTEKYTFTATMDDADTIILSPEDHIMIRYEQDYKRQDIIYVKGEVKYPGVYAIDVGNTKIGKVLEKAGGYTSKADKTKLFINNKSISKIPDREKDRILIIPEENRSAEEKSYIKARMLTEKGTIESTSLDHAQSLMELNVTKNDEIYIPENFNYIEVLGAVSKPGRYPFSSQLAYSDYIELAGGFTDTATRKRFIIKAGTGQRLPIRKSISIENGDTIFIPDRLEYNRWILFKDILATLGNAAALVVVIQNAIGP